MSDRAPLRDTAARKRRVSYRDLSAAAARLENPAVEVRQQLGLGSYEVLPHEDALKLISNLSVYPLSSRPMEQHHIAHARCGGYSEWSGLAHTKSDGSHHIIFNDAHELPNIRVTLMEEFFHLYLKHPTETFRNYPGVGGHRDYNSAKEKEAYGCGTAALVPFHGLAGLLARAIHLTRIAEHYNVPTSVVEDRISVTSLGDLSNRQVRQYHLGMGDSNFFG